MLLSGTYLSGFPIFSRCQPLRPQNIWEVSPFVNFVILGCTAFPSPKCQTDNFKTYRIYQMGYQMKCLKIFRYHHCRRRTWINSLSLTKLIKLDFVLLLFSKGPSESKLHKVHSMKSSNDSYSTNLHVFLDRNRFLSIVECRWIFLVLLNWLLKTTANTRIMSGKTNQLSNYS